MNRQPAYYASIGTAWGDFAAVLHLPYTFWHLAYVAIGAGASEKLDWSVLAGTVLAFFFGTGIAAHAFDELHSRPLRTSLSDLTLRMLGLGGFLGATVVALAGAFILNLWVLAWAAAGILLAGGYAIEQPRFLHTPFGFAIAWGAFPVLVGYWAQANTIDVTALAFGGFAILTSLAQRSLSTSARNLRRTVDHVEVNLRRGTAIEVWEEGRLLASWETALRLLAWSMPVLALALLSRHVV